MTEIILYNTDDGKVKVDLLAEDGTVWLTQKQMAELFDTSVPNINMHISNILKDKELLENSVIKYYLITAEDGKNYNTAFYALEMILAIGFRVRSKRGVQFRTWANQYLSEFLRKGFILNDDRLKNPNGRFDYFDELLARIRDIRASEKRFYQKVRDLFALSCDYDKTDRATQMFFAQAQNKLLYAVTGQTANEIIVNRANSEQANMGLRSWKGEIVRKGDIFTAKNYLNENELDTLNRLVVIFLDTAELKAKKREMLTMAFWLENLDKILAFNDQDVLSHTGSVSNALMKEQVTEIYAEFNQKRKATEAKLADLDDLNALEMKIKNRF